MFVFPPCYVALCASKARHTDCWCFLFIIFWISFCYIYCFRNWSFSSSLQICCHSLIIFFFSLLRLWYFSFSFLKLFIYSFSSFLNNLPRGLLTLFFSCCIMSDSLVTPWTVAHQAPLSMGLSRQEYWSEFPFPTPGIVPSQGLNLCLPHWQAGSLALSHRRSPC